SRPGSFGEQCSQRTGGRVKQTAQKKLSQNLARQLAQVDVLEIKLRTVALQLDLAGGIDRFVALPVVLHHDVVDNELIVELHVDTVSHHLDVERVPLADGPVGHDIRLR